MQANHIPVLRDEVIAALDIKPSGTYLDLTVGYAGHASAILARLTNGKLIGFDQDKTALAFSTKHLQQISNHFALIHSNFMHFATHLAKMQITKIDGALIDLGVSSPQIDNLARGFSYKQDGPLDMRMDTTQTWSAATIVNEWTEAQIMAVLQKYGETKFARRIATAIVANRPIETTAALVKLLQIALPSAVVRQKNPAKTVFQALRMATNDEETALNIALAQLPGLLNPNGVIAVITFNSLEDKIVKDAWHHLLENKTGKLPIQHQKTWRVKTFKPTATEIETNHRARSAKLRILVQQ